MEQKCQEFQDFRKLPQSVKRTLYSYLAFNLENPVQQIIQGHFQGGNFEWYIDLSVASKIKGWKSIPASLNARTIVT